MMEMSVKLIILKMLCKQKIVHFLEEAGENLGLAGPQIWHAVQLLNILENFGFKEINRIICRSWSEAQCFALSLLNLTSKLDGTRLTLQDYKRTVQPNCSGPQYSQLMLKYELTIMSTVKWRLASPLLVDEVSSIANAWQQYTGSLKGVPIFFQQKIISFATNKTQLSRNTRICLYNLSHLIKGSHIESLSQKIRCLSLAIFFVTIKQTFVSQIGSAYINDFLKRMYNIVIEQIDLENTEVSQVLGNYQLFRERSRGRKESKKAKPTHKSNKQSQDKENIKYYVNRQKRSTGKVKHEQDMQGQPIKSRSRSRKDPSKDVKGFQIKDSVLTKGKKKINSAKSLFYKQSILLGRDQQCCNKRKCGKFSKSKGSKISDKSQVTSKLIPNQNSQIVAKSTYCLKANSKKSNNCSIRMKLR